MLPTAVQHLPGWVILLSLPHLRLSPFQLRWDPVNQVAEWSWLQRMITASFVMPHLVLRLWHRLTTKGKITPSGCVLQRHRITHSRMRQNWANEGQGKKGMSIRWCRTEETRTRFRTTQVPTSTPARARGSPVTWPCVWRPVASSTAPCATRAPARRWSSGSTWRANSTRAKCPSSGTGTRWRTWATSNDAPPSVVVCN